MVNPYRQRCSHWAAHGVLHSGYRTCIVTSTATGYANPSETSKLTERDSPPIVFLRAMCGSPTWLSAWGEVPSGWKCRDAVCSVGPRSPFGQTLFPLHPSATGGPEGFGDFAGPMVCPDIPKGPFRLRQSAYVLRLSRAVPRKTAPWVDCGVLQVPAQGVLSRWARGLLNRAGTLAHLADYRCTRLGLPISLRETSAGRPGDFLRGDNGRPRSLVNALRTPAAPFKRLAP